MKKQDENKILTLLYKERVAWNNRRNWNYVCLICGEEYLEKRALMRHLEFEDIAFVAPSKKVPGID